MSLFPHRFGNRAASTSHIPLVFLAIFACMSPIFTEEVPTVADMKKEIDRQMKGAAMELSGIIVGQIIDLTFPIARPQEKPWNGMGKTKSSQDVKFSWVSGALQEGFPEDFRVAIDTQLGRKDDLDRLEKNILESWPSALNKNKSAKLADARDNSLVIYYTTALRFISSGSMHTDMGEVTLQSVVSKGIKKYVEGKSLTFGNLVADAILSYKPMGLVLGMPVTNEVFASMATKGESGTPVEEKYILKPNDLFSAAEAWSYKGNVYFYEYTIGMEKVKELGFDNIKARMAERFGYAVMGNEEEGRSVYGMFASGDGHRPVVNLTHKNPNAPVTIVVFLNDVNDSIIQERKSLEEAANKKKAEDAKAKTGASGL